jgi:RNA polymerase sigma-70 factor (family 1)
MFVNTLFLDKILTADLNIYLDDIRSGNQQAFEKVFRQLYAPLCHYAHNLLHNKDEAEDLVQNTFVHFWEKRQEITVIGSLKAYLYKAVYNHSLNKIKHWGIRQEHQSYVQHSYTEASLDHTLAATELQAGINKALSKLPEQCAKVFGMSRFDELKYQEIADILGISVKTVENQMGKALKIMRAELAEYLVSVLIFLSITIGVCTVL